MDDSSTTEDHSGTLVDAGSLLAVTEELRDLRDRIDQADVTDEQRQRWRSTLGAIAEGAADDLDRAAGQLRRLAARVERGIDA